MNELAYGATDLGRRREGNEDSYLLLPERGIYMVADGMGGHNAGEVASSIAAKIVAEYFTLERITKMKEDQEREQDQDQEQNHNQDQNQDQSQVKKEMIRGIQEAHQKITAMSRTVKEYAGMGSTIVLSFIHHNVLHTCHVGDSRIYVINQVGIIQITNDHSVVAELVQMGKMSREEARYSPLKNQITQALGSSFSIDPEYNQYLLHPGDKVLLCSDGLWDMLSDEEIHSVVTEGCTKEGYTKEEICRKLIDKANQAGGDDNITVVLVESRW